MGQKNLFERLHTANQLMELLELYAFGQLSPAVCHQPRRWILIRSLCDKVLLLLPNPQRKAVVNPSLLRSPEDAVIKASPHNMNCRVDLTALGMVGCCLVIPQLTPREPITQAVTSTPEVNNTGRLPSAAAFCNSFKRSQCLRQTCARQYQQNLHNLCMSVHP